MKTILPKKQWYGMNATPVYGKSTNNDAIDFIFNKVKYRQHLMRGFYGNI